MDRINDPAYLSDDGLVIYLFHGVVSSFTHKVRNYVRKHLEKDYFYQFLKDKCRRGTPLSLDEVIEIKRTGKKAPKRSFAVTFDDGFENNHSIAAPILADLNLPATFYVTTDFIESNTMSWIDRIELCLESAIGKQINLPWEKKPRRLASPADTIEALKEMRQKVKNDRSIDQRELVSLIFEQCEREEIFSSKDPLDQKMGWSQVKELESEKLFTVGGHSHTHAILAFLDDDELKEEIDKSIALLKARAGIASPHYSYPEGLAHCYDERVIEMLKEHGVTCSPTAIPGVNDLSEDLFHLKRVMVV